MIRPYLCVLICMAYGAICPAWGKQMRGMPSHAKIRLREILEVPCQTLDPQRHAARKVPPCYDLDLFLLARACWKVYKCDFDREDSAID